MSDRIKTICTILLLAVGVLACASTDLWQQFSSSNHFSVMYPANWFRIGISTDRLQILSSKGGAEGIIIKKDEAEIIVMAAQASPTSMLDQVINNYIQGTSVLSRRVIPIESGERGCSELIEVISKEQPVPQADTPVNVPYIINTDLFCETTGHTIVTLLRSWEGDKRQKEYQRIALRMAKSIKTR